MNIIIKNLTAISKDSITNLGFNGYNTHKIYTVQKENGDQSFGLSLTETKLDEEYIKEWETKDSAMDFFNAVIVEGYSYGAYYKDELLGFILLSRIVWNNTIWIENIRVKESYQGMGIGAKLLGKSLEIAKNEKARLVGLETQSANHPAIQFYKRFGFEITGIDLERYPQRIGDFEQVGILMSYNI